MFSQCRAIRLFALMSVTGIAALAGTYHSATFTGNLSPGSANVQAPFNSVISQSGAVGGSFVFDDQLVPAAGTGYANVFFSDFPDIVNIPNATAFYLNLGGGIAFDLGSAVVEPAAIQSAAIQYKDGSFHGFFFVSDFMFQGSPYELNMQGTLFAISPIVGGYATLQNRVTGSLNSSLTNVQSFVPTQPADSTVPEPGSYVLLGTGLAGLAVVARMRRQRVSTLIG